MSSHWTRHRQHWSRCRSCRLCQKRMSVVLARGTLPCDVLFVGEAPGISEDVLGRPFVGPAGKLLDSVLDYVEAEAGPYRYALTNIVACVPLDESMQKVKEPPKEAVEACHPRLVEFIDIAQPRAVITLGTFAQKYLPELPDCVKIREKMTHPAAILRADISKKGLAFQRCKALVLDVVERLQEAT